MAELAAALDAERRVGSGPMGLWNPQGIAAWPGAEGSAVPLRLLVADTDNHRLLWLAPVGHVPSFDRASDEPSAVRGESAAGAVAAGSSAGCCELLCARRATCRHQPNQGECGRR